MSTEQSGAATEPGAAPSSWRERRRAPQRKRKRKIRRRFILGGIGLLIAMVLTFVGVVYATTDVPRPDDIQTDQVSIVYFSDGTTEMARLGEENRTDVPLSQVPQHVREAVLSAENRSFYSDPGFSVTGIARAAWNNVSGGPTQGGSTITQQYVKNAYLSTEQTLTRKFKELILSVKIDQNYSKDQILEWYLNTIYFGRGAHGIEAAAETYFGKPVDQLTVEEGAVLAAGIASPALYDPEGHPEDAQDRWDFVLDGMVEEGWLEDSAREAMVYPAVLPRGPVSLNQTDGPEGLIIRQVQEELAREGIDESRIYSEGLRITTTINAGAQREAVTAATETLADQPGNLRTALVSISPTTGAVVAYYGGPSGTGFDYAQAYRQPGSSFKPYTLAAGLEQGIGVFARRDGSQPQTFPDREQPVRNSEGGECSNCSLKEAITRSLNTTFYGLALEVGPDNVADLAHRAGVRATDSDDEPTLERDGITGGAIGIGEYEVRPIDQASGFSTFANGGVHHEPFFVSTVTDQEGNVLYERAAGEETRAVSAEVANDVTFALEDVPAQGDDELADGREAAAKTGTAQLDDNDNKDAWMVGFVPSLVTAVWIGSDASEAIRTNEDRLIYGSGLPSEIWKAYMNAVLAGAAQAELPDEAQIEGDGGESSSGDSSSGSEEQTSSAPSTTTPPPTSAATTTTPPPATSSPPPTSTSPTTSTRTTRPTPTPPPSTQPPTPPPTTAAAGTSQPGG
ncbi:MAG: penicillin-binding protein [Geodermatophilaceae bacterium]|nr:penicillin-binding protein [Geodermatophilaceae bacterium]